MSGLDTDKEAGHQPSLSEKKLVFRRTENQSHDPGESQGWVTGSLGDIKKNLQLPPNEQTHFHLFLF